MRETNWEMPRICLDSAGEPRSAANLISYRISLFNTSPFGTESLWLYVLPLLSMQLLRVTISWQAACFGSEA